MPVVRDFVNFLKEYGVLALALGVLVGDQINALEKAFVDDIIMPFVGQVLNLGDWREATISVGNAPLKVGHFLAAVIDFVLVAFTVFMLFKVALRIYMRETRAADR